MNMDTMLQIVADELNIECFEIACFNYEMAFHEQNYMKVETRSFGDFVIQGVRLERLLKKLKGEEEKKKELIATLRFASGAKAEVRGSVAHEIKRSFRDCNNIKGWVRSGDYELNLNNVEEVYFEYKLGG